jgi:hypothetical protein
MQLSSVTFVQKSESYIFIDPGSCNYFSCHHIGLGKLTYYKIAGNGGRFRGSLVDLMKTERQLKFMNMERVLRIPEKSDSFS